jgi:hypothetical protein
MWLKATEKESDMSQHDFNIANQGFPAFRSDLNSALGALASLSSGATAPTTTYANQLWYDTATNLLKMRNELDNAWITLGTLDQAGNTFSAPNITGVTSSVAELNVLDGILATTNQLNSSAKDTNAENRIINGNFNFWQRGTSSTASGYVAVDRWVNALVGGTVTQSRQAFALGDTFGSTQPAFYLRQTVSGQTLVSHYASTVQRIEGVRTYAGQTITILGWVRRSSGAGNMVAEGEQNFGTGGSPSATVTGISPTTVTLTASWAPFAVVMTVPSVTGKTLGSNGNDFLALNFWTSAGTNFNARANSLGLQTIGVDLWGVHVRVGTWTAADAALYRPRDLGTELALCLRYYELLTTGFIGNASGAGALIGNFVTFTVPKRSTPAGTALTASESTNVSTTFLTIFSSQTFRYYGTSAAAGAAFVTLPIAFDAEL